VLGTGDADLAVALQYEAAAHPGRVGVVIGYNEPLAHLIQAGGDALLVPSRFEPCGLTQLCALRYGSIPVVSMVGGLADTVTDATGVRFHPVTGTMLLQAINRCAALYQDKPAWQVKQRLAMDVDVSWAVSARQYATLYRDLVGAKA
jgi:starch synthase